MKIIITDQHRGLAAPTLCRVANLYDKLDAFLTPETFGTPEHDRKQSAIDTLISSRVVEDGDRCVVWYDFNDVPVFITDDLYEPAEHGDRVFVGKLTEAKDVVQAIINVELRDM